MAPSIKIADQAEKIPSTVSTSQLTLKVSHSPDPDDALAWWAWRTGIVAPSEFRLDFTPLGVEEANQACLEGELDVAAISSAAYPLISDEYVILSPGASVGRNYGPALVSNKKCGIEDLAGRSIAVPGALTTGAALARLFLPRATLIPMEFRDVAPAVISGLVDGGVLIHEELLNWQAHGVQLVRCLGEEWTLRTSLPLTVGVVVARRSLGAENLRKIAVALEKSVRYGLGHRQSAESWAMEYSCEAREGIGDRFIDMFTNDDTIALPADCRKALGELWRRQKLSGHLQGDIPEVELIDGLTVYAPEASREK